MMKKPESCPLCALARGDPKQHKTEWFWLDEDGIVVEDLDSCGYTLRLLYVPSVHVPCGQEPQEFRRVAERLLTGVARALCVERGLAVMNWLDFSFLPYGQGHWHAQLGLMDEASIQEAWDKFVKSSCERVMER